MLCYYIFIYIYFKFLFVDNWNNLWNEELIWRWCCLDDYCLDLKFLNFLYLLENFNLYWILNIDIVFEMKFNDILGEFYNLSYCNVIGSFVNIGIL